MSSIFTRNSRLTATTFVLAILALGFTTALVLPVSAQASSVTIVMPQGVGSNAALNFQPASMTVASGTTVTFSDQDTSAPHDVVWDSVPAGATPANSPQVMTDGQTYSVALTVPGTYTYHCAFHSGWMKGTIIVTAGAATSTSTSSSSITPVVTSTSTATTVSPTTTTSTTSTPTTTTTSTSTRSAPSETSTSTATTVSNPNGGTYTLQVSSVDQNGAGIFGFHVSVSELVVPTPTGPATPTTTTSTTSSTATIPSIPVSSGFTTYSDKLSFGVYQVAIDSSYGGCTFSQWKGSISNPTTVIRLGEDTRLVAVYKCAQSKLQIVTQQADGAALTGYYVTLLSRDGTAQNCYSTCSFTVDNSQTYLVFVDNFGSESFSHFTDHRGSAYSWGGIYTESVPAGSASGTITLTAVYTSSHSTGTTTTTTTTTSTSTNSHTSATTTSSSTTKSTSTASTSKSTSTEASTSSNAHTSITTSSSTTAGISTTSTSTSASTASTSKSTSTSSRTSTTATTTSSSTPTSTTSTSTSKTTAPSTSSSTTTSATITSRSAPSTSSAGSLTIVMPQNVGAEQSLNFSPASTTIAPGTIVTFSDQDSQSGAPHDVVWTSMPSGASPANSPEVMMSGQTFSVTLTVPGTYTYHCIFHSWMTGTIIVS